MAANDDVLVVACNTLSLERRLRSTPEGAGRDLERGRVERLLKRAGLRVRAW